MNIKSKNITAEDVLAMIDKLQAEAIENAERKKFEQLKAEGEIVEAHLIVHPSVAIHLKKALFEANIDAQMYITRLAPLDKIYVLTDRRLIEEIKRYRIAEEKE